MIKLWGLTQKNCLIPDGSGLCTVMLSELFPLREEQPDIEIKFRADFTIMDAGQRIDLDNFKEFQKKARSIAFLNAKGATFTDAVIFCTPMVGIQEKQSVVSKKRIVGGLQPSSFDNKSFLAERAKFPAAGIFVLISDDYKNFTEFAGPLIALRNLYCNNELNPKFKKMKLK